MDLPSRQSSGNLPTPEGSLVEVSGLGVFRMRDIHDALSSTEKQPIDITTINNSRANYVASPEDSDCSWTHEEEDGKFYFDINRRISNFASSDESKMTLPLLSRSQRRFVHATAQIMHLGHASLGPQGRQRQMLLFKHDSNNNNKIITSTTQEVGGRHVQPSPPAPFSSSREYPKKRKRLPRILGGFPCQFSECTRIFDRASERKKHEQSHQPAYTNQHQCTTCGKGFRYRKDLTRHFRGVHLNSDSGLGESFGSSNTATSSSILTSDSRVASDTSLSFLGWTPAAAAAATAQEGSGAASPLLQRRRGDVDHNFMMLPQAGVDFELFAPPQDELWLSSLPDDVHSWSGLTAREESVTAPDCPGGGDRWEHAMLEIADASDDKL